MKRRLKMALPLLFAFILTLLPFGLLEYSQHQRGLIQHERTNTQWEQKAGNYLQLFKSLWSTELQIKHRLFLFKKARQRVGFSEKYSGELFLNDLHKVFPAKYMPEAIYAGVAGKDRELRMFSGPGFTPIKQRFFKKILEGLARNDELSGAELDTLNSLTKGAFGEVIDFSLLKGFRRGKVTRVLFEGLMKHIYWDVIVSANGQRLVYLQVFSVDAADRVTSMRLVADILSMRNPEICSVLVPLEFADKKLEPVFDSQVPKAQKLRVLELFNSIKNESLARDNLVPAGKFVDYQGVRILRNFIDYAVPFEVWILSRADPEVDLREPFVGFLLRLFFFAGWLLVFCKVLISGHPVGISLKSWLNLTFIVVGILPLAVFFVAGIFHIDSAAFRREQEAVKDALRQLEEADASGEVILAEYRDACRRWTQNKEWMADMIQWNEPAWERAIGRIQVKFAEAGLKVGAVYVYPPDIAGVKDRCFPLPGIGNSLELEQGRQTFYSSWIKKAYYKVAPEMMNGPEPEMAIFSGKTGQKVIRVFLANRGDIEFIDLDDEKQFIFQDYILENGKPHNWYFFRFDITQVFEEYLRDTVSSLQRIYSENLYSIAVVKNGETRIVFPDLKTKDFAVISRAAGHLMELAAVTRTMLIEQSEDKLIITYPCVKSGSSILTNVVFFSGFRSTAYQQELILTIIVLLMAIPVFLIARLTADYLVSPLMGVENGLRKIAVEDYSISLHLNRDDELGTLTRAFDHMVEGLRERRNLGRFVSAALDKHIAQSEQTEQHGLENRPGAVLCSDIRAFTTLSESNDVRDIVAMLNEHLTDMSECVRAHGGLVEQFIGDAILAVFHGQTLREASEKAIDAGVAMMRRHQEINMRRSNEGKFNYGIGVGIEAGQLLSGVVTAGARSDYTVVGIARTTAEELEATSRHGRFTRIIVSPQVHELAENYSFMQHSDGENFELASLESGK